MSPLDSCNGSTSTTQSSAASSFTGAPLTNIVPSNVTSTGPYSVSSLLFAPAGNYHAWNERNMSDYRNRVPALPPPSVPSSYPHGTTGSAPPNLAGPNRSLAESYPATSYTGSRTLYQPPLPGPHETQRFPPFPSPSQSVETSTSALSSPGTGYNDGRPAHSTADAPPFDPTVVIHDLHGGSHSTRLRPNLEAKIHKGFFQVDNKWTCYRRNYFSVSCSFSLQPSVLPSLPSAPFYLHRHNLPIEHVRGFKVLISAKTQDTNGQEGETRNLVQHTAKRDKATESTPAHASIHPRPAPPLTIGSGPGGNASLYGAQTQSEMDWPPYSVSAAQGPQQNNYTHTFERIQFQKATANNGKRRAQQQFYHLVVELFAEVTSQQGQRETDLVRIATKQSSPMVVRGRSPGHYKDARRDSSSSLGPGDGAGHLGDGGGRMPTLNPNLGSGAASHPSLMPYDHGQRGQHLGRGTYRPSLKTEHSSTASDTSSSSPTDIEQALLPGEAMTGVEVSDYAHSATGFNQHRYDSRVGLDSVCDNAFDRHPCHFMNSSTNVGGDVASPSTGKLQKFYRYGGTSTQEGIFHERPFSSHELPNLNHHMEGTTTLYSGNTRTLLENPYNQFAAINIGHSQEMCS